MPERTLILWRHAKSAWGDGGLQDFDRPLAARGRWAAPLLAQWIYMNSINPDVIICSPAKRTRQTLEAYFSFTEKAFSEVCFEPALYEATSDDLFNQLGRYGDALSVLLVGHNPALQDLALQSLNESAFQLPGTRRLLKKFPTAAACVLRFSGHWADLDKGIATLVHFIRPKDLDQWRA